MDVLWVIFVVIMYVGTIFFIYITEEKEREKLIQEYNELVDDIECEKALNEKYEKRIGQMIGKIKELRENNYEKRKENRDFLRTLADYKAKLNTAEKEIERLKKRRYLAKYLLPSIKHMPKWQIK